MDVNAGADEDGVEESEVILLIRSDAKYWHFLITRGDEVRWSKELIPLVKGWYTGPFDFFKRIA